MAYAITQTFVTKRNYPDLYEYLKTQASANKLLKNAALFRMRNWFTSKHKVNDGISISDHEQLVRDEVLSVFPKMKSSVLSYTSMLKILSATKNPDFYPGQTAQNVVKQTVNDFQDWLSALKVYKKDPSKFTGCPQMPKYEKSDMVTYTITNQDAVIRESDDGRYMKFPYTKATLPVPACTKGKLKEVKVVPVYDGFKVIFIMETDDPVPDNAGSGMGSIDFGVSNTAAIVSNTGLALLYKGGYLKSVNQWANKQAAYLQEASGLHASDSLTHVWKKRNGIVSAILNALASDIVKVLIDNNIGVFVAGHNDFWKQNSNMGSKNNQTFTQIPFNTLLWMLQYRCERNGILFIEREESYTSKASFIDEDCIPTYGVDDKNAVFSGKRNNRFYKTKEGLVVNADLNGAGNILVKEFPDAFNGIDRKFILDVKVKVFDGKFIDKDKLPERSRPPKKKHHRKPRKRKSIPVTDSGPVTVPCAASCA